MSDYISPKQFHETAGVADWRLTSEGATAFFRTRSFAESARFVQAISDLPGVEDHRPGVDVRHDGVTVHMITHTDDYFGPSQRDVQLARQISQVALKLGLTADPSAVQSLLIIPGATNIAQVTPFWRAVLGYEPRRDSPSEDLIDPHERGPAFWFEQMNQPRGDGGGAIHVAIWVPYEQAEARIVAALAAGGRMVRDEFAPSWWTLADAAGNEADIATEGLHMTKPQHRKLRAPSGIMNIEFSGKIWYWRGPAPWFFVTVPAKQCSDLRAILGAVTYGWGMIPANVRIGNTEWKTSLFPKNGRYIVPIKASVRKVENLEDGDQVTVRLQVS